MAPFGYFSEEAQNVLSWAKQITIDLKQNYIGSEHILLGLLKLESNVINNKNFPISYEIINEILIEISKKTNNDTTNFKPNDILQLSPGGKSVIDNSVLIAKKYNKSDIIPEFIWLSILQNKNLVASKILLNLNLDFNLLIKDIIDYLNNNFDENYEENDDKEKFKIENYTSDITEKALKGELDPLIGRSNETERIIQILSRRTKNNPVLIGEPGVGKTAIVEGLAIEIANNCVPDTIQNKKLLSLDIASMVAGSKYRGEFEERLKKLVNEVKKRKDIILFIDEIHTIVGAGGAEGTLDAANILKPSLARGEIQCIGATTQDEYRKYFEKDGALERRFQPIQVDEPTENETLDILKGLNSKYEEFHGIKISDEALVAAVKLSERYINDRFLPDKAINLIDETAARVKLTKYKISEEEKQLKLDLNKLKFNKQEAINNQNFELAGKIRNEEISLSNKLESLIENKNKLSNKNIVVSEADIESTISMITGIKIEKLSKDESNKLMNLEKLLHKRVIGQEEAINAVSKAIRRSRAGLQDPNRPLGSCIFLGPTGVGKTELCRALSEVLFDDEKSLIKLDMSEYMEKHSVSKLIGSPPGYVGYDEGGQLTNAVRQKPYSVILFDEIEKAHPDVFNILLQVLEDGRLTDSEGRIVNFKNTIIVMTSNAGAHQMANSKKLGFGIDSDMNSSYSKVKQNVMQAVKETFKPEFINRLDEMIVFHELSKSNIKDIIKLLLKDVAVRMFDKGIILKYTPSVVNYILEKGYSQSFGARPIKRTIQTELVDKISEHFISGEIKENEIVNVFIKNKKIELNSI